MSSSAQMQAYHQCYLVYIPSCKGSSQTYLSFHKHCELKLEKPLHKHLSAGGTAENICAFVQKGSLLSSWEPFLSLQQSSPEELPCPTLCFPCSLHWEHTQPNHPTSSRSVWERWQRRAGLSLCFYSITLLILPATWQIADETGYCFGSLY